MGNNLAVMDGGNQVAAPVNSAPTWSEDDIKLIQDTVAKDTTSSEFKLFLYTASKYQLDPLIKQIWCVKYKNNAAQIFTGRDGFLSIAHRSGKFNGMDSGVRQEGKEIIGWCKVYRNDMDHPFYVEVALSEYSTGQNLWNKKPRTMIQKVAESQALRRAFDISGLYSPEEIDTAEQQHEIKQEINFATQPQLSKIFALANELGFSPENMKSTIHTKYGVNSSKEMTKQQAHELIDEMTALKEARQAAAEPVQGELIPPDEPNTAFNEAYNEMFPDDEEL